MSIQFNPADNLISVLLLQQQQVNTLTGALDIFWLKKTYQAIPYLIQHDSNTIGYFFINEQKSLLEFFITNEYLFLSETVFKQLLDKKLAKEAYLSTRNPRLLSLCLDYAVKTTPAAYLFYDLLHISKQSLPYQLILATQDDTDWLNSYERSPSEIIKHIDEKTLFILSDQNNTRVGIGKISINPLQTEYSDVGAWVKPNHRNKGLGTCIINQLKTICYQRKVIPTCGCDIDNLTSKRMLEKAGFYANDRILKVSFKF
ncbi:MAG: hypothetical protein A3E87_00600 [Gammaproteobacteria bacterium RIFCSPHIGHO2_12_FULL_35_23]|nr:MAG: hypothetical protein A3E87_00600 [Gammaproteobacteria bacterium RIFCSPHIGHO2_12_FULL_35_23]